MARLGWAAALLSGAAAASLGWLATEAPPMRSLKVSAPVAGPLPVEPWLAQGLVDRPGRDLLSMTIWRAPGPAVRLVFAPAEIVDVDPASGRVLPASTGRALFEGWRRPWSAVPEPIDTRDLAGLVQAWSAFDEALAGRYERATLIRAAGVDQVWRFEFTEPGAWPGETGIVEIDRQTGRLRTLLHAGERPWRDGGAFGALSGMLAVSMLSALAVVARFGLRRSGASGAPDEADASPTLVAYASQSGTAESLAQRSAAALRAGGVPARVRDLAELTERELRQVRQALFIVATTGLGEAPDHARPFARQMQGATAALDLRYGLLALGDRRYEDFCGFGRQVAAWLQRSGAAPLFTPIDVDSGDPGAALARWQSQVAALGAGDADARAWQQPAMARWRLTGRRRLNPGSAGRASFHLEFEAIDRADAQWQAGDIAEIRCGEVMRDYSIASIPQDGAIHLLVRQVRRADGRLGAGSGWLTDGLAEGAEIELRIRSNAGFHAPPDDRPLLLIGNGTGLAGLRAHLRARVWAGRHRNWLIFGERNQAHDYYHRDEIEAWLRDGHLERLDLAFSRDAPQRLYVQHRLHAAAELLRDWLADGAAIYVCGSSVGMAPEVEAVLTGLIGPAALDALVAEGRYRRDVY